MSLVVMKEINYLKLVRLQKGHYTAGKYKEYNATLLVPQTLICACAVEIQPKPG